MNNEKGFFEISEGIYWVGDLDQINNLHCNPYLLIDDDEGILFDPGSVLDFEAVYQNISKIIPLENIKYVVLHHQDPDLCASMPLFEKRGLKAKIITHWRTAILIKYYGVISEFYITSQNGNQLTLSSGRQIMFIHTPYLHFPGNIITYDPTTKILFSSDLFGAILKDWKLYADENYIEAMKTFHEAYMPGNDIMRPVMDTLLRMDINIIAPQHGSIIKDNIKEHIRTLRDLECGTFLNLLKKNLAKSGGYHSICNQALKRYYSIFSKEEVMEIFDGTEITFDKKSGLITDFSLNGEDLWDFIFQKIYTTKGASWLTISEQLVRKLSFEYNIKIPDIFENASAQREKQMIELYEENIKLSEINDRLKLNLSMTEEKLIRCPITNLYNESFFINYLNLELANSIENRVNSTIMVVNIDGFSRIEFEYGKEVINEILKGITNLFNNFKDETHLLFKMDLPGFAYYIPNSNPDYVSKLADDLRNNVMRSEIFFEPLTVSIGIVNTQEFFDDDRPLDELIPLIVNISKLRLRIAKNKGMNMVISESSTNDLTLETDNILIVDPDQLNREILTNALKQLNYTVFCCSDGEAALKIIEQNKLNLIISELIVPKLDGFLLKEKLLSLSSTMFIPFILISHKKDEESIQRAAALNILFYFKKPYILPEIINLAKNLINKK